MNEITEAHAALFLKAIAGDEEATEAFMNASQSGMSLGWSRVPTLREAIRDATAMSALAVLQGVFLAMLEEMAAEAEPAFRAVVKGTVDQAREDLKKNALGGVCSCCKEFIRLDYFAMPATDWTPVMVMRHLQERGLHLRPEGGLDDPAPSVCIACLMPEISDEEVLSALRELATRVQGRASDASKENQALTDPDLNHKETP